MVHLTRESTFWRVVVMVRWYADALAQSIGIEPQNRTRSTIFVGTHSRTAF
jgi:hypothetical protein